MDAVVGAARPSVCCAVMGTEVNDMVCVMMQAVLSTTSTVAIHATVCAVMITVARALKRTVTHSAICAVKNTEIHATVLTRICIIMHTMRANIR
jgi:hypothetical protein